MRVACHLRRDTAKAQLKLPLNCHRCGQECRNMPGLKAHIVVCQDAPKQGRVLH